MPKTGAVKTKISGDVDGTDKSAIASTCSGTAVSSVPILKASSRTNPIITNLITAKMSNSIKNATTAITTSKSASTALASTSKSKDSQLTLTTALPLLMNSAAVAAAKGSVPEITSSAGAQAAAAAAAIKQKLKSATAAAAAASSTPPSGAVVGNNSRSTSSSTSSNSSLSSSNGIVSAISTALQKINIITSDNSDTDTDIYPPPATDLSESDEESVSEILLAYLCLRPDLLDEIPESDPESCGHDEAEGNDDEDDGDDEDEEEDDDDEDEEDEDDENEDDEDDEEEIDDEEDEEILSPNEVISGNFLLDSNNDRSRKLSSLFQAAANEKAPVLRHATHAIDETKQALTKMRCANSPRDKTQFSRTLIAACTDNDVNTVRRLLGKGNVNINESTDDGESLLSMACSAGYYELAQVLLAMSAAQVEDKGQKDCTPLMEAASAGHLEIVKLLLSHNADVNAHCATGNTPLMFACAGGHVEVVKELLKHGANVEEQNENGHTPLMEAASAGHVEVAKVLLEHGAGINTHSNEFKESALTLACYKGHLNMVRFLLQAGADQEHKTDEMHTALMEASMDGHVEVARLLLDSGAQVNMPTDSFESPLTLAACGGHVELATLLIERGANIEEVNDEGYTPLMEAAREGHEEMVALLLNKGANINATTEETQETALTLACCGGFSEVAEFLIKEGANLELGASTPLMEAAQEGHTDLVRFLLQNKANVHAETQTGDTALTHASENGHTDASEVLLYYGAELEHESEGGRTPLMKACRAGHLCTVKFLIQKSADVNKQTSSNDHTPLSLACAGGHQAVVELLLKSGADPFHKLKDNSTMLIEAAKGGHTRVVELLFKYPHFTQNHQNELQSASAAAVGQLRLINLHQQKQMQQKHLQHQLQQHLNAPPGLQEVSEAVRASNQQLFHQQQFNGSPPAVAAVGEYFDEQIELSPNSVNEEFSAIDINSLSAQQQEALIAKSRLFHLQAGFEQGLSQGLTRDQTQLMPNPYHSPAALRKQFDMTHINSLTPPQKAPPAPPVLQAAASNLQQQQQHQQQQQQQQAIKVKNVSRKIRQPPAPFELNLPAANNSAATHNLAAEPDASQKACDVRSQPVGDDGSGNKHIQPNAELNGDELNRSLLRRRVILQEYKKLENKAPSFLPLSYMDLSSEAAADGNLSIDQNLVPVPGGMESTDMHSPIILTNAEQQIMNMPASQAANEMMEPSIFGMVSDMAQQSSNVHNANQQFSIESACFVNKPMQNDYRKNNSTPITTPSEVSQSTAISDRPKVKPVSKKDAKNYRKATLTHLPAVLEQNQMVSIYNNLPLVISNETKPSLQTQQAIMSHMVFAAQQQHIDIPQPSNILPNNPIPFSNSPASPLQSPSSVPAAINQQCQQSCPTSNASSLSAISNTIQQPQLIPDHRNSEITHSHTEDSEDLNEILTAQYCQTSDSLIQEKRGTDNTVATMCEMNMVGQQEYLKKFDVNTQMKLLQLDSWKLYGQLLGEHPKSPTETPPEQHLYANTILSADKESGSDSSERKNLATLCSAAAVAANIDKDEQFLSSQHCNSIGTGKLPETHDDSTEEPSKEIDLTGQKRLTNSDDDNQDADTENRDQLKNGRKHNKNKNNEMANTAQILSDSPLLSTATPTLNDHDMDRLSPTKTRKLTHQLESLILSNVALKGNDLTPAICDFRQSDSNSGLTHPQMNNNLRAATGGTVGAAIQQQLMQQKSADAKQDAESHDLVHDCLEDVNTNRNEIYPALNDTLGQFNNDDDSTREQMYDIAVEMDEIFQVIQNVNDPSLQELTSNLNCAEIADFGINSICKTNWNGNWAATPKWNSQDHLINSHQKALLSAEDHQHEQQRQANQLLLDYQLQQQLQQQYGDDELREQLQHQQTALSLIPFTNDEATLAAQQQQQLQQSLPNPNDYHLQQQQQQLDFDSDNELREQLHKLQKLQHQQATTRHLKPTAISQHQQQAQQQQQQQLTLQNQPQTPATPNYIFNVEGSDKPVQLLFQLPPIVSAQSDQDAAQQLQHLQLDHQELQDQQKHLQQQVELLQQQQQQILHDLSHHATGAANTQQQQQAAIEQQEAQNMLLQQQQSALAQQVLSQQVLKQQKTHLQQQQLLLQRQQQYQQQHPQQPQPCVQHTQQVQVATQTQSTVIVPHQKVTNGVAVPLDQQQAQQLPSTGQLPTSSVIAVPASMAVAKMSGGVAKKVIDKQSRKDRNRYSLLRQTPAGSQTNAASQQPQYQQPAAAPTVDKTIDVDSETDSNHDTALTLACAGGHEELVDLLLSRGANIEHRDKKGFTPLILAATAGHEKVVEILLKHGAELEAQSERTKDTPLSLACSGGRYEVVELLLNESANKEHRNVSDYTPLSLAASGGYVNIIKLLLSNGAEINSRTGSKLGISPLMLAAMNGHTAAVKLLLDQGSDINAQIETNRNTALTLACFQGRHEVVSLLLDRKANVEHRAKTGLTPLMEAASGGYIEVGRVLLDKGADVNAAPVPTSRDTALTIAADKGHLKFVELLLSRGASVEVKNKKGNSPLWLAAHGGHLSVVEILYTHNADIDSQDNRRVSCLMAAFRKGHTKVVKWMVQYVTQFPSDQEMNRFISTISDKELSEKCYDCMNIIRAAKEAQAVKANKNASILLEELDMERSREESRRAAAARRRERKKKKKMEKKEEKRRQMEGSGGERDDLDGKDSDKDDESDKDDNVDGEDDEDHQPMPQNYREEGDSGIDQGSCSSTDIKGNIAQPIDKGSNKKGNKKKQKNLQQPQPVAAQPQQEVNPAARGNSPIVEEVASKSAGTKAQTRKEKPEDHPAKLLKKPANEVPAACGKVSIKCINKKVDTNAAAVTVKKEDSAITNKKKETNKQREKENLAPKELATSKQHQQCQTPAASDKSKLDSADTATTYQILNCAQQATRKSTGFATARIASSGLSDEAAKRSDTAIAVRDVVSTKSTAAPKRGEDGWKEVVRKSSTQQGGTTSVCSSALTVTTAQTTTVATVPEMTCKKVQVPVNAISRVIGRAGSNINAIRATTGAHIEVEKQGKNQSERSITIKGLSDATKQAHLLILTLIKDPDVDILQMMQRSTSANSGSKSISTATPMSVGTWDNKTALQPSSSSSSSSASSTPAVQALSSQSSTANAVNTVTSAAVANNDVGHGTTVTSTKVATTCVTSLKSAAKSHALSLPSSSSKSLAGRSQPAKSFYAHQPAVRGGNAAQTMSASLAGIQHKQKMSADPQGSGSSKNTAGTYGASAALHKTLGNSKASSTIIVNSQTFAAKLTGGGQQLHGSPKKLEGGRIATTAPYGRGKPAPSSACTVPQIGGATSDTFPSSIFVFNPVDGAAGNAAPSGNKPAVARSVSPIGPPNKYNISATDNFQDSTLYAQQSTTKPQMQLSQQSAMTASQQHLEGTPHGLIETANAAAIHTGNGSAMHMAGPSTGFGNQLAAKLNSEYTLFNDTTPYQAQWGDGPQMYNPTMSLVDDALPTADASKAPGYNRNILSSPVGSSKTMSNVATSSPDNMAIGLATPSKSNLMPQQNLNLQPNTPVGTAPLSPSVAAVKNDLNAAPIIVSENSTSTKTVINMNTDISPAMQSSAHIGPAQTSSAPPVSGLAIQRPVSSQHRNQTSIANTGQTVQAPVTVGHGLDAQPSPINFGTIGPNSASARVNGGGASTLNDQSMNRYYEHMGSQSGIGNVAQQMHFQVESNFMHGNMVGGGSTANVGNAGNHPMSRLNPRASSFSHCAKSQQPVFHQTQQQTNPANYNMSKSSTSTGGLMPNRSQSLPQGTQAQNQQRWYNSGGAADYSGYVVDNNMSGVMAAGASPALSPNQSMAAAQQSAGMIQQQGGGQVVPQQPDDLRKMPRPIGTERASWKYNYPNSSGASSISSAGGGGGIAMDDTIVAMSSAAGGVISGNVGSVGGPIPPWMLDKPQLQQQHQHSNWLKQQYRYYGNPGSTAANITNSGMGMTSTVDYHHPQEQFHMAMDYHPTVQPPNIAQNAPPINLMQNFPYPQFVGHVNDMSHMTEKVESWDKHTWPTNWTN